MGKGTLLLAIVALVAGGSILYQSQRSSLEDGRQAERDQEVLAHEIAQSGHSMIMTRAQKVHAENPRLQVYDVVDLVNGPDGHVIQKSQGGSYKAWLVSTSPETYSGISVGTYGDVQHRVQTTTAEGSVGGPTMPDVLEVTEPSELEVTFLRSMAGYCSALYLERILPDLPEDAQPAPDLIFAPGNNREGSTAHYEAVLQPGTRLNFILAVDADFNCEKRNAAIPITHWTYDYTRPALVTDVETPDDLQEGKYAMIQERPGARGTWRIAFEDLVFSDAQLADVKANGYGNASWKNGTYGGNGWSEVTTSGYYRLREHGHMPDFSDQVIEIRLMPLGTIARR